MREKFVLILFVVFSSVSKSYPQRDSYSSSPEDCEKYCFSKCDQYRNDTSQATYHRPPIGIWLSSMVFYYQTRDSNDYKDCLVAKEQCQCDTRFNIKNPILWLAFTGTGITLLVFLYYICRRYILYHAGKIFSGTTTIASPVTSPTVNTISNNSNNTPFTDFYTGSDYEDKPPDYDPPPSYYDISEKPPKESEANNCNTKSDKKVANYMTFK